MLSCICLVTPTTSGHLGRNLSQLIWNLPFICSTVKRCWIFRQLPTDYLVSKLVTFAECPLSGHCKGLGSRESQVTGPPLEVSIVSWSHHIPCSFWRPLWGSELQCYQPGSSGRSADYGLVIKLIFAKMKVTFRIKHKLKFEHLCLKEALILMVLHNIQESNTLYQNCNLWILLESAVNLFCH